MKHLIALLLAGTALAVAGPAASAQPVDSMLSVYAAQYGQEAIYIHYDKSIYFPGDTLSFKAYLRTGTEASTYSRNFYADWYDATGALLAHTVSPVFESSAQGRLALPASLKGRVVQVKAYTKWMLNFDRDFLYTGELRLMQPDTGGEAPAAPPVTRLAFFPEGGDLCAGLSSRIAFMATGRGGIPVRVTGVIRDHQNAIVDSLRTVHDGMGSCTILPLPGETYTAEWQDEQGRPGITVLPPAKNAGVVLRVLPQAAGSISVAVTRVADAPGNLNILHLVGHMHQQPVIKATLSARDKATDEIQIPVSSLPTGVLQLTLFDAAWMPLAERVVFINNHEYAFTPEVKKLMTYPGKRTKAVIEIDVPDSVTGNLSVSVTDAELAPDSSVNIFSGLLLTSDIKGYVHHPAWYFSGSSDDITRSLDLVMLTHGWRRFNWERVRQGLLPPVTYPQDTDYIRLSGKAPGTPKGDHTGEKVVLLLQAKDSSKQVIQLPLDRDGSFAQDAVVFFDTIKVFYSFSAKNRNRAGMVVNTGLLPALESRVDSAAGLSWNDMDAGSLRSTRSVLRAREEGMSRNAQMMKEYVVKAKARTRSAVDILDERYANGMFAGGEGYRFDVLNDPRAQSATDVYMYLQGMIPGLTVTMKGGESSLSWRNAATQLYLDGLHADANQISGLPMADVAYIKVFRPPFFGAGGNGDGGAVAIYTRKGGDAGTGPGSGGMPYTLVGGYTAYRQFYSPDYDQPLTDDRPDVRTTIYWNPYVLTDARNHTVKLTFFKNDITRKMRVIVEGVTSDGKLAHVEQVME